MSKSKFDSNLDVSDKEIVFEKDFDNSKYTIQIPEEELNKYSENQYQDAEKKMDIHLLCQVSEQRCKPYICSYSLCIHNRGDPNKCYRIYYMLSKCIEKERKKVVYQFLDTGKQPMT